MPTDVPYCGLPPVPGALAWNLDPLLIGALLTIGALYGAGARLAGIAPRQQAFFYAGWLLTAAALISPLCNLSVALFSARVAQHMILTLVAAPLVVLGEPVLALTRLFGRAAPRPPGNRSVALGTAAFAAALWIWHLPGPYDATLRSDAVYWAMHLTTFAAALLLWRGLLHPASCAGAGLVSGVATAVQMTLFSCILSLAPSPLFVVHARTTQAWGLSPLTDQQLGGLIMWVPGGLLFTLYGVAAFAILLQRLGQRSAALRH
jgi:putative membrane protein